MQSQYQVKVQGQEYKTFTATGYSISAIHNDVRAAIAVGGITVDSSKPVIVEVVKV